MSTANQPTENRYCPNCYHPLEADAQFCDHCGQKYTTGKVSVFAVLHEFFDNFIGLDSAVLRSIPLLLFKPGQLTVEFFKGKHKRYVSPVRLFLFTTLVYFAILTYYTGGFFSSDIQDQLTEGPKMKIERAKTHNALIEDIDSTINNLKKKVPSQTTKNEIDSAFKHFQPKELRDSIVITDLVTPTMKEQKIKISLADLYSLSSEEVIEKYGIVVSSRWERMMLLKILKITKEGGNFVEFMLSRLSWLIFILLPLFALVMKVLYYFNRRYFVEHLVFGLHFHSFLFIAGILMLYFIPLNNAVYIPVFSLGILVYLFKAMRRFYGQSFWKTSLKYFMLLFSFIFVIIIASLFLVFISVALF